MELSGDLSDFALTDILQILALSRKTGVLSLKGADYSGKIVLEGGRIAYASCTPGESLYDRLLRERMISPKFSQAVNGQANGNGSRHKILDYLVTNRVMSMDDLEYAAKRHFRSIISDLLMKDRGKFWIDINQNTGALVPHEIKLREGLNISEVLLEVAKENDETESGVTVTAPEEETDENIEIKLDEEEMRSLQAPTKELGTEPPPSVSGILYSLLMELKTLSFEAEVSLLVMRYASEISSRGILFWVKGDELRGWGQFGFKFRLLDRAIDEEVRRLRIPLSETNVLTQVARTSHPYIGPMPDDSWHEAMVSRLGVGSKGLSGFVLPLAREGQTMFLVYGDDYPGGREMKGVNELVILSNQASLALEKFSLERMLSRETGDLIR